MYGFFGSTFAHVTVLSTRHSNICHLAWEPYHNCTVPKPAGEGAPLEQQQAVQRAAGQPVHPVTNTKRGVEDSSLPSSATRAHTPCCLRLLAASDVEMSTVPMPEDAKETNALCEDQIEQPDVEAFFERRRSQPQRESSTRTYFTKPALGPSSMWPSQLVLEPYHNFAEIAQVRSRDCIEYNTKQHLSPRVGTIPQLHSALSRMFHQRRGASFMPYAAFFNLAAKKEDDLLLAAIDTQHHDSHLKIVLEGRLF